MKTILVLTDFSKSAKNAAEAAIKIAEVIHADILLLNAYVVATMLVTKEPMPWPLEYYKVLEQDSIDQLKIEEERLLEITAKQKRNKGSVNLSSLSRGGSLAEILSEIIKEKDITMIFMGGRHNKGSELLFGSDINHVINHANRPVFIISADQLNFPVRNVVFATDLSDEDINSLNYVISLAKYFKFHIHVCHVTGKGEGNKESDHLSEFERKTDKSKRSNLSFKDLKGQHISEELTKFADHTHADLLVLTHKKHSFFWRILNETPATDLTRAHKQPLLILPCSADSSIFIPFLPFDSFIPDDGK